MPSIDESRLYYDTTREDSMLELLSRHFKDAETFCQYGKVNLKLIIEDCSKKVLGKNFTKMRISKKKGNKILKMIQSRLAGKYNSWIHLTNFKIKGTDIVFQTNLHSVLKVPKRGVLYGCLISPLLKDVFLTTHSVERMAERINSLMLIYIMENLLDFFNQQPTTPEILESFIIHSDYEFAKDTNEGKKFVYLNIGVGILVMEDFDDLYIVKTLLSHDMCPKRLKWKRVLLTEEAKKRPHNFFDSLHELLDEVETPIDGPTPDPFDLELLL